MSKIQQVEPNLWVGPETMGVTPHFMKTDHAIEHYLNGSNLIHDPLQPGNAKRAPVYTIKEAEDMGEVFEGSSAGGHEGYLDMRVNSVTNRDGFFYMGLVGLLIWWTFDSYVLSSDPSELSRRIMQFIGYGGFLALSLISLFRPLAMPVRFHKANQEVYVWHKKVLYRIPWDECEISICVAKQIEGYRGAQDGYQLTLWLNPKHATNKDLTGQKHVALNMFHNMGHHIPLYAYWEYVRRYMTGDKLIYIEMSKKPRRPRVNYEFALKKGESRIKAIVLYIVVLPFVFLFQPNKAALLTPFKAKWPEEVHEWTGERCDWN